MAADKKKAEEMQAKRKKVVEEMLSTEETYISALSLGMKSYFEKFVQVFIKDSKKLNMIGEMFMNMSEIIEVSTMFYNALKMIIADGVDLIGALFLKAIPTFSIYDVYHEGFNYSGHLVTRLMKDKDFKNVHDEILCNIHEDLESFLIRPCQHVPRYSLLVRELKKTTPPDHKDTPNIDKAVDVMNMLNMFYFSIHFAYFF